MNFLNTTVSKLESESRYSTYLSFFRVMICILLLKKIISQWTLVPLLYGGSDFLEATNSTINQFVITFDTSLIRANIYIFLGIYILLILLFLFGVGKNITAFFLFIFYDILQKLCPQILNGGDNFMRFILLYLCFADSFRYLSLANSGTVNRNENRRNFFSNLSGLSICIHLCMIYFVSAIHKIHADVWFNGVATYYTFNLERFNGTSFNKTLGKNEFFVTISTYFTWLIELMYPLLIWFRQTKKIMIVCMILLHVGIAIFMMLYDFQVLFILVQGFFISDSTWNKVYLSLSNRFNNLKLIRQKTDNHLK